MVACAFAGERETPGCSLCAPGTGRASVSCGWPPPPQHCRRPFLQDSSHAIQSTGDLYKICYVTSLSPGGSGLESPHFMFPIPNPLPELHSEFAGCGWEVKARLFLRCHASKLLCLPSGIPPVSILFNCHLLILFSSACFFSSQDLFVVLCWFLLNYSSLEEKSFPEPATQKAPSIYFR